MSERWRPVPGHDGYEVSDLGRVRSVDRVVERKGRPMRLRGRVLIAHYDGSGHLQLGLGRGHANKKIHALVMLAFVGPYPDGMEILHIDHDKRNNTLANLKHGSRSENVTTDFDKGTRKRTSQILARWNGGETTFATASRACRHFGISTSSLKMGLVARRR